MASAAANVVRRMTIKKFEDIPGPKSYPIIGTLHNYLPFLGSYSLDRLHHSGMAKYRRYGKMVREEIVPGVKLLYLYDPVDIETLFRNEGRYPCRRSHTALEKFRMDTPHDHKSGGLLPTNGVEWANMRGQYQQSLNRENVRTFISQTDEIVAEFLQRINDQLLKEETSHSRNFLPHLMALYLELIGSNLFSIRFDALSSVDKEDSLSQRLIRAAEKVNSSTLKADNGPRLWRWIDTPLYRSIKSNLGLLEQVSRQVVTTRLTNKKNEEEVKDASPCLLKTWLKEGGLEGDPSDDIRDIVTMSADMVLAGIDTTAFSSSFILYHLATHQQCQEELSGELKTLLPHWDSPVTSSFLSNAPYLKRVIKESLRLNPISIGIGRILTQDTVIGNHHIPQGTVIVTQNQVTCRLEEYFDRPNDFVPERWDTSGKSKMRRPHPYTMIPFGHGPRGCVGRRLAEQNIQIVIAKLIRNFRLEWRGCGKLDCLSHTINKPDHPLTFSFTRRLD